MAINYTIQAEVVDIQSDIPQESDIFFVDTNVWYWHTYSQASSLSLLYQTTDYPLYISKAISAKSLLLYTGLSLAELAHNIEAAERNIFMTSHGAIRTKEYRHNYPTERAKVAAEVSYAWNQIKAIAAPINLTIDEPTTDAALTRFQTQLLDGYDLLILEAMNSEGVVQMITDDSDFSTVPGIQLFTANRNVLTAAQNQGKLFHR